MRCSIVARRPRPVSFDHLLSLGLANDSESSVTRSKCWMRPLPQLCCGPMAPKERATSARNFDPTTELAKSCRGGWADTAWANGWVDQTTHSLTAKLPRGPYRSLAERSWPLPTVDALRRCHRQRVDSNRRLLGPYLEVFNGPMVKCQNRTGNTQMMSLVLYPFELIPTRRLSANGSLGTHRAMEA